MQCPRSHQFAGVAGIGKSQLAMTLSVLCALENPDASVLYIDTEHNFSAKRYAQVAAHVQWLVSTSLVRLMACGLSRCS